MTTRPDIRPGDTGGERLVELAPPWYDNDVVMELIDTYRSGGGSTTRVVRRRARSMWETIMKKLSIVSIVRDDMMNYQVFFHRWGKASAFVVSPDLYTLLSTVDMDAGFPVFYHNERKHSWKTTLYLYKITEDNRFISTRATKQKLYQWSTGRVSTRHFRPASPG